jgi:hypothetical protein
VAFLCQETLGMSSGVNSQEPQKIWVQGPLKHLNSKPFREIR